MRVFEMDPATARLERLYRDDGARLERALILFGGDREVARDAVAEAFAQALRSGGRVRDHQAWVWRAAFRIAAGELKRRRLTAGPLPELAYEMPEPLIDVMRALHRLSPKQRASVILHHYAGYPAREVAHIIGSTPPAVTVHLAVGRSRLRELLEDDDDEA
jgi:DNA-directed RNA polymerase specialized sigma24 family protein